MQLHADELRARLAPLFQENFEKFGEIGAAISVWQNGKELLELQGGICAARRKQPWTDDTLVLIWSATKGLGSACLLHVLQEHKIDIERRVGELWPEFAPAGKEKITLAQLLSHQAGLAELDRKVDILDYAAGMHALEKQEPNWPPGSAHGYHARTFGFLLDELVRRISGITLSEYWRKTFAEPLKLDLWIGLPAEQNARVATIYAAKTRKTADQNNRLSGSDQFYADVATKGTFANKVFSSPHGLNAVSAMNKPEIRALPIVSFGGIGSASSLGKFYAMLANGGSEPDGPSTETAHGRHFSSDQQSRWMATTLTDGVDHVFQIPTPFSAGFMKGSAQTQRRLVGPSEGLLQVPVRLGPFGHPGAGGSHAFADPENRISFAYVMNQMEQSILPTEKSLRLVDAIYGLTPRL